MLAIAFSRVGVVFQHNSHALLCYYAPLLCSFRIIYAAAVLLLLWTVACIWIVGFACKFCSAGLSTNQLVVFFSHTKSTLTTSTSQPVVLFSHNKSAPATSHSQPNKSGGAKHASIAAGHCLARSWQQDLNEFHKMYVFSLGNCLHILGFSILQSFFHTLSSVVTMYTFNSLHRPSLQLQSTQWHPHHTCIHTNRFTIHFGPVSMEFVQPRGPWLQYVLVRSWRFVPHQAGHDPEKTRDRHPTISIKGHSSFCW